MRKSLTVITCVVIVLFSTYNILEHKRYMSFIPNGMEVSKIIYTNEDSWGFGPGGNESGIFVYEISDNTSKAIQKLGVDYFSTLPPKQNSNGDWQGVYDNWHETPISERGWLKDYSNDANTIPSIGNYLNQYGFGIPIEKQEIVDIINYAVSKNKSFYSFGRIGVFIIIPEKNKAIYAYAG